MHGALPLFLAITAAATNHQPPSPAQQQRFSTRECVQQAAKTDYSGKQATDKPMQGNCTQTPKSTPESNT